MLTKQESILEFDFSRQSVTPDRLTKKTHAGYLDVANDLLQIYQRSIGESRRDLHRQVENRMMGLEDCSARRVAAFCKLLDDASGYEKDTGAKAARLRKQVFTMASQSHPLVAKPDDLFGASESDTKRKIAEKLNRPWPDIQADLFADVIEFHRLKRPPESKKPARTQAKKEPLDPIPLDGATLLRRYNVAQTQTALYGAVEMIVWANRDFKTILRYAKLARLMHTITRQEEGYVFRFNGPASIIRGTRRYGVAMAKFLPGLLAAEDWRMRAIVIGPLKRRFALQLSSRDGLQGEIVEEDYDSELERTFEKRWQDTDTDGWTLHREATLLHNGQTVFFPDFTLRHADHAEVLLEIIGFWTPEYLREKATKLATFREHGRILLAISDMVQESIPDMGIPRIPYKTRLNPKAVLEAITSLK